MLDEDLSEPATAAGLHEKEKNHAYAFALLCLSWKPFTCIGCALMCCKHMSCHATWDFHGSTLWVFDHDLLAMARSCASLDEGLAMLAGAPGADPLDQQILVPMVHACMYMVYHSCGCRVWLACKPRLAKKLWGSFKWRWPRRPVARRRRPEQACTWEGQHCNW